MAVRTDDASARFDAEIADAVATNRLDAETARALRWWQRASVRTAEAYAATVARNVFTVTDAARNASAAEMTEAAASWQRSLDIRATLAANAAGEGRDADQTAETGPTNETGQTGQPGPTDETDAPLPPVIETRLRAPIVELAAVRLLTKDPRAVKSALANSFANAVHVDSSPDLRPTPQAPDLTATTVTSATVEGKDRGHAHPASTA